MVSTPPVATKPGKWVSGTRSDRARSKSLRCAAWSRCQGIDTLRLGVNDRSVPTSGTYFQGKAGLPPMNIVKKTVVATSFAAAAMVALSPVASAATTTATQDLPGTSVVGGLLGGSGSPLDSVTGTWSAADIDAILNGLL